MDRGETTALLRAARDGSPEAMESLFGRCAGRLLALIRLRLGGELRAHLESRDVLQACLLRSFERIDQFERSDAASLMGWLARIAENEIRDQADYVRRQRRDARRTLPLEDRHDALAARIRSSLSQLILDEQARRLELALESLGDEHRDVILLRKYEERSWSEIGERMGRTPDACRMLMARAMTALTLAMDDDR